MIINDILHVLQDNFEVYSTFLFQPFLHSLSFYANTIIAIRLILQASIWGLDMHALLRLSEPCKKRWRFIKEIWVL